MKIGNTNNSETNKEPTTNFIQNLKYLVSMHSLDTSIINIVVSSMILNTFFLWKRNTIRKRKGFINKGQDIFQKIQYQHYEFILPVLFEKDYKFSFLSYLS